MPQNVGQLAAGSAYNSIAPRLRPAVAARHDRGRSSRFSATNNLDFIVGVNSYKRTGDMPFGAALRVQRGHRAADRDRQPRDRAERGDGVGEPPGHVPRRLRAREVQPEDPLVHLRQPAARDRLLQVRDRRPGRRAPATTRAATPTATARPTAACRMRRRTPSTRSTGWAWSSCPAGRRRTPASAWAPTTRTRRSSRGRRTPRSTPRRRGRRSPGWPSSPVTRPRCGSTTRPAPLNVSSRAIKNLTLTARYRFNSRSDFTQPFEAYRVRALRRGARGDGRPERAVQHQPQHPRRQRRVHRRFRTARSAPATCSTSTSTASARRRAGRTTRPASRTTSSATSD